MNPVAFLIFPYVLDTPKNANPTKSMQILHASYANPMQIPHTEHRKRGPNVGPRCLLRSHLGSSSSAYISLCCSSLIVAMPPKGAQTKAKAKAQAPCAWHRSASVTAPPFWHPYVHIFSSKKVLLPTCTCLTQAGTSLSNTFSKLRGCSV